MKKESYPNDSFDFIFNLKIGNKQKGKVKHKINKKYVKIQKEKKKIRVELIIGLLFV